MKRLILPGCLALLLVGCGTTTITHTVVAPPTTVTVAPQTTSEQLQAPDPTLDAQCIPQPNRPPSCTQGSYGVAITIGAPCDNPSVTPPAAWQYTYAGSETARCMTVER